MSNVTTAAIDRRVEVIDGANNDQGAIQRVSELRALPFVVLLGEPGIGKSTVLGAEAALEGVPILKVRELMTGTEANPAATLYLDALDEYRTDGQASDKVHGLAQSMAAVKAKRWRLSCRSEDWRKGADTEPIRKTTAGAPIVVARLCPLDHAEAVEILVALGEREPEGFLAKARSFGAAGFVESPLSLNLLHKAVADGGKWPNTRYDLFASAIRRLAFERNQEHKWAHRHALDDILAAAADTCLLLLTSGARAIWRSNDEPPEDGDSRAYVIAHDLGLNHDLLEDMLDTALFRGEGEVFEPMHRTIADFLAGESLAKSVVGTSGRAAFPLSRAVTLITGADGLPPTELRGLYAWFTAHLRKLGDTAGALRLIEADAVTVLIYGDAAVFDTTARRSLLANLDRNDPYFRASEIESAAVGGLAGEDLADGFIAALTGPSDGTHRLPTVLEALTSGPPVLSLRPLLRAFALDAARPEWMRRRAIEAYLNGIDNPASARRELFDALAGEPTSLAREALRAQQAALLPTGVLKVEDVKSVLADFRRLPKDSMVGRLFALQRRLENDPLPELFDESTGGWLPKTPDPGHTREVERLLDYALAGAIKGTLDLSAARLWRWTVNVRLYATSTLKDQTAKALAAWINLDEGREAALFDAMLTEDDPTSGPWFVTNKYITTTRRHPSAAIIRHVLAKARASSTNVEKKHLLAIAVDIARRPASDIEAYWEVHDCIASEKGCKALLRLLTVTTIEEWRLQDYARAQKERQLEAKEKAQLVQRMAPALAVMRVGGRPDYLDWAARRYFEITDDNSGRLSGIQRVTNHTDERTTEAIVAGWKHLATTGLGGIDAAQLGKAEAESRRYYAEVAAIAGLDQLICNDGQPAPPAIPLEVAVAVLKSGWAVSDQKRQNRLERWTLDRLNCVPTAGALQLVDFWGAALDAGATQLHGIWRLLEEDARGGAVTQALDSLLETRRTMAPQALRSVLRVGAKHLSHTRLLALADAALADPAVTGEQRTIWSFVAFALDPVRHADRFIAEHGGGDAGALFDKDLIAGLDEALGNFIDASRLHRDATVIRLLGRTTTPANAGPDSMVGHAINRLAGEPCAEAGVTLLALVDDPSLTAWRPSLRHAQTQQARLRRDQSFRHPTVSAVRAAISGGPPVNANELRAVVMEELRQLSAELHTAPNTPWKEYWNLKSNGKVERPLIENQCRNRLLGLLGERLKKYSIVAALPEAQRGEDTRADLLFLSWSGRNLPLEAKRHFHPDLWVAAATQLQGYSADPGADGFGIYLVFWFGNEASPAPSRPDGRAGPTTAIELETMLAGDLSPDLRKRTEVIVFDVSDPAVAGRRMPRQRRGGEANPVSST